VQPERWRESELYRFGCDLYNHGFLWEAHEAWEELWHPAKAEPLTADFLQGLIQCSAACLKLRMDQPTGFARLTQLGAQRLERVVRARGARFMGLDVGAFAADFRNWAAGGPTEPGGRPLLLLEDA
jgi:hypothetical protein